jgi:hypothetical protein|eukprot:g48.t1
MTEYVAKNKVDDATIDAYKAMQKKTFTRWVNIHLKKRNMPIENLFEDTKDCVAWCNLMEIIGGESIKAVTGKKFNKKPRIEIQKTENGNFVLEYCKKRDLGLVNVGSLDFVKGNSNIILGFIWKIILRFVVAEDGQEGLMLWAKRACQPYNDLPVTNFHKSWKDGRAFVGMIHKHRPDLIANPNDLSPDNAAENCELAFKVAEEKLGIDRLLDVEDIIENEKPDEKSIATYVSQFYVLFAKQMQSEQYIKSILTAVAVTRRHDDLISKYNAETKDLKEWIMSKSAELENNANNLPNNTAGVRAMLTEFYDYRQNVKPTRQGELIEIQGILGSLHSSAKGNNRPMFRPADGLNPADLEGELSQLEAKEHDLEDKLRQRLITFQRIDFVIKRFTARGDKMVAWTEQQHGVFEAADMGAGVSGAEVALANHDIYKDQLSKFQAVLGDLNAMNAECQAVPDHDQVGGVAENFSAYEAALNDLVPKGEAHEAAIADKLSRERSLVLLKAETSKAVALAVYDMQKIEEDIAEPIVEGSTDAINEQLEKLNGPIADNINEFRSQVEKIQGLNNQIVEMGSSFNGPQSAQDLINSSDAVDGLEAKRADRVNQMAERKSSEDYKEDLRVQFAEVAKQVTQTCADRTKTLANISGEPEAKMQELQSLAESHARDTLIQTAEESSEKCTEAKILINSHTDETIFSLRAKWSAVGDAYKQAMDVVEQLIMDAKGSQLTAEQIKEVREVFDYFDQDKDNSLDQKEFRDACQGIGLILDDDEVLSLYLKCTGGPTKKMGFEGFSTFMYDQLKTGASLEDVMNAFKNLSGGAEAITSDQVTQSFQAHGDVSGYLLENMNEKEGGLDYNAFTVQLFTR